MHILIAEDHPDIAAVMARLVVRAGHEASVALDGLEAIRLADELAPDLVLLDINMPGIDGYETARRLRDRFADRFPIFAVTAAPVDVPLAKRSGFDGFFAKPFDRSSLTALIEQFS